VVTHRLHKICKQRLRESYLPVGKPDQLFNYPGEGVEKLWSASRSRPLSWVKKRGGRL